MFKKLLVLLVALSLSYSCSSDDDTPATLEEVQYEVLAFEFIPDTGNNTNRLSYEIRFTNPNAVAITGWYQVSTTNGGLTNVRVFRNDVSCTTLAANSGCTFFHEEEASLDNGFIPSRELVDVSYFLSLD